MWQPHSTHTNSTGVHCPHYLVHRCHHCSHMLIPVLSPWLSGYIYIVQTILIILTMAGLFQDRPCIPVQPRSPSTYRTLPQSRKFLHAPSWSVSVITLPEGNTALIFLHYRLVLPVLQLYRDGIGHLCFLCQASYTPSKNTLLTKRKLEILPTGNPVFIQGQGNNFFN